MIEKITEKAEGESSNMSLAEKMFGDQSSTSGVQDSSQTIKRPTFGKKLADEP